MSDQPSGDTPVNSETANHEITPGEWWINRGDNYWKLSIDRIEKHYSATYLGHFCVRSRTNSWSETPVAAFYQETPAKPEFSNYFGLYFDHEGGLMICDARSITEGSWHGLRTESGEIIYSRFRHDFRHSTDGSIFVDGGRDYLRSGGTGITHPVRLSIIHDKFVVNDTLFFPVLDDKKVP